MTDSTSVTSPPRQWPRTTTVLVGAAAFVIVVAGIRATSGIIGPIMLAAALTIVFHPLRRWLDRYMPSWASSVVVLLAAYLLIVLMTLAMVISIGRLAQLVPQYAPQINQHISDAGDWLSSKGVGTDQVNDMVSSADVGKIAGVATDVLASIVNVLSSLLFLVLMLMFMAFDSARATVLMEGARQHKPEVVDALVAFCSGVRNYLGVSAVFGLIVAVIDTVLLYAMGVPGAFVWGVLAFVTNFIPNIGFIIGVIPPALVALLDSGPGLMVAVIVMYCVVNFIIQSVIQPKVIGASVGLSTSLTFVSLVFWTWVLGPLGALLAVPMSLLAVAVLVQADPGARWLDPVVTGIPGAKLVRGPDDPPDATRAEKRASKRAARRAAKHSEKGSAASATEVHTEAPADGTDAS